MSTLDYELTILNEYDPLEEWDHFVDLSPQGCIYCRSWWLKAVCPQGFKIYTLRRGQRIVAGVPLPLSSKSNLDIIRMPLLTQTLGMLILPSLKTSYESRLSEEMEIMNTLIAVMPKFARFSMHFHYTFTNWLPFYWGDYQQTTRYTYVIEDLTDLDKTFSNFSNSKRRNITKAEQIVKVYHDLPAEDFYAHHKLTLAKKGLKIVYPYKLFKSIHDSALNNFGAKTLYAKDEQGNIHSAIFIIFDSKSAYYLINSIDKDYSTSGATTLLVREALTYVSKYTKRFDFEGSMIRDVENSCRRFGAIQMPYFHIHKDNRLVPVRIADELRLSLRTSIGKAYQKLRLM